MDRTRDRGIGRTGTREKKKDTTTTVTNAIVEKRRSSRISQSVVRRNPSESKVDSLTNTTPIYYDTLYNTRY